MWENHRKFHIFSVCDILLCLCLIKSLMKYKKNIYIYLQITIAFTHMGVMCRDGRVGAPHRAMAGSGTLEGTVGFCRAKELWVESLDGRWV